MGSKLGLKLQGISTLSADDDDGDGRLIGTRR